MDPRPIVSEAEYKRAVNDISAYFENQPSPGTPDAARFDALAALIDAYEETHYPMNLADEGDRLG